MDNLDFKAWNGADWNGLFAHYHTDDVVVDVKGQKRTNGIGEHIDAMKEYVESTGGTPPRSPRTRSGSDPVTGPVSWAKPKAVIGW